MKNIRNFCIIAHIDHGKSTLADRILELTNTISKNNETSQLLDALYIERERGITIKSHAVQINYKYKGINFVLNLIDTPGHVDFSYEVSRAIAACEGALLVVDASKSIQAQTISNLSLALKNNLSIIPVLNKIDLPESNIEKVTDDIVNLLGCNHSDVINASAKKGIGINEILKAIIEKIPFPKGNTEAPLQALIFDSIYTPFRGVEVYFRIFNGQIRKGDKIKCMSTGGIYIASEIGILRIKHLPRNLIKSGNVGYIISGIKNPLEIKVGDTLTLVDYPATKPIEGFKEVKPMVFAGIYPQKTEDYEILRFSLEKLHLNDAALKFSPESSAALGFGFRCGFLGIFHMEIIKERLEREYGIFVITTLPNVSYKAFFKTKPNKFLWINNPLDITDFSNIIRIEEPFIIGSIITMEKYLGNIMSLCIKRRGLIKNLLYLHTKRVEIIFEIPLTEIVVGFYDKLKTISKGYSSFDYSLLDYRCTDLVKIEFYINAKSIDALSILVHKSNAFLFGKNMCKKLSLIIPRQQFEIPIQAVIGSKVIARENIKALRKDVTDKCYGGDISRKIKLLEKQKLGKKKLRKLGKVEIPSDAFISIFKLNL